MSISDRKKDHIELSLRKESQYSFSAGFERIQLMHNALPECSLNSIDLSTEFLKRKIRYPLMITAVTGGYPKAKQLNKQLASAAQKYEIGFGLGSQRAMIENPSLTDTFKIRDVAPNIPILANIGAAQLKKYPAIKLADMVSAVDADALAIHLNPLQEIIQPEGDSDFSGVLNMIKRTAERINVPVIVKETGAGMSTDVAIKLKAAGVSWLDVSGAGGTSWSRIEYMRQSKQTTVPGFEDWGIKTVDSIMMCKGVLPLIASGGVRSGIDAAKAIALGADMAGAAEPFLKALMQKRLDKELETWEKQMKIAAFLTGSRTLTELKKAKCIIS